MQSSGCTPACLAGGTDPSPILAVFLAWQSLPCDVPHTATPCSPQSWAGVSPEQG